MQFPARLEPDRVKPKLRLKSTAHRDFVRSHFCSVPGCQLMPIEVAHVRRGSGAGIAQKPSDAMTLSLCREHHAEQHRKGEETFERIHGINMMQLAEAFYRRSPHRSKLDDPYV